MPAKTKKLKTWTDDFSDARNWLIRELGAFRGEQYFAGIFDHKEKRSVFKEKGRGKLDLLRFCVPGSKWVIGAQTRFCLWTFFKIGAPLAQ